MRYNKLLNIDSLNRVKSTYLDDCKAIICEKHKLTIYWESLSLTEKEKIFMVYDLNVIDEFVELLNMASNRIDGSKMNRKCGQIIKMPERKILLEYLYFDVLGIYLTDEPLLKKYLKQICMIANNVTNDTQEHLLGNYEIPDCSDWVLLQGRKKVLKFKVWSLISILETLEFVVDQFCFGQKVLLRKRHYSALYSQLVKTPISKSPSTEEIRVRVREILELLSVMFENNLIKAYIKASKCSSNKKDLQILINSVRLNGNYFIEQTTISDRESIVQVPFLRDNILPSSQDIIVPKSCSREVLISGTQKSQVPIMSSHEKIVQLNLSPQIEQSQQLSMLNTQIIIKDLEEQRKIVDSVERNEQIQIVSQEHDNFLTSIISHFEEDNPIQELNQEIRNYPQKQCLAQEQLTNEQLIVLQQKQKQECFLKIEPDSESQCSYLCEDDIKQLDRCFQNENSFYKEEKLNQEDQSGLIKKIKGISQYLRSDVEIISESLCIVGINNLVFRIEESSSCEYDDQSNCDSDKEYYQIDEKENFHYNQDLKDYDIADILGDNFKFEPNLCFSKEKIDQLILSQAQLMIGSTSNNSMQSQNNNPNSKRQYNQGQQFIKNHSFIYSDDSSTEDSGNFFLDKNERNEHPIKNNMKKQQRGGHPNYFKNEQIANQNLGYPQFNPLVVPFFYFMNTQPFIPCHQNNPSPSSNNFKQSGKQSSRNINSNPNGSQSKKINMSNQSDIQQESRNNYSFASSSNTISGNSYSSQVPNQNSPSPNICSINANTTNTYPQLSNSSNNRNKRRVNSKGKNHFIENTSTIAKQTCQSQVNSGYTYSESNSQKYHNGFDQLPNRLSDSCQNPYISHQFDQNIHLAANTFSSKQPNGKSKKLNANKPFDFNPTNPILISTSSSNNYPVGNHLKRSKENN